MFDVQSRQEGEAFVLSVHGSLKYESLPLLRGAIKQIFAEHQSQILVINLEGMEFIDSSGISFLIAIHHVMKSKQGSLRLCGLAPHVGRILDLVNLSSFFCVFPMEQQALHEAALASFVKT